VFANKFQSLMVVISITMYSVKCYIYIDYHHNNIGRCHVYSLPFNMERIQHITHSFPVGRFMNVGVLRMFDYFHSFKHNFFAQIPRSFPFLTRLTIWNTIKQKKKSLHQLVKSEEILSIMEYSHLVELTCTFGHMDYVEQFLFNLNIRLSCLSNLHAQYEHLVTVTANFTGINAYQLCKTEVYSF
jgi:hypothetical protein